jgi:hypothetical protein
VGLDGPWPAANGNFSMLKTLPKKSIDKKKKKKKNISLDTPES